MTECPAQISTKISLYLSYISDNFHLTHNEFFYTLLQFILPAYKTHWTIVSLKSIMLSVDCCPHSPSFLFVFHKLHSVVSFRFIYFRNFFLSLTFFFCLGILLKIKFKRKKKLLWYCLLAHIFNRIDIMHLTLLAVVLIWVKHTTDKHKSIIIIIIMHWVKTRELHIHFVVFICIVVCNVNQQQQQK